MEIVLLSGGCGVGKKTVGESLAERVPFPLIHNHMTTNIARSLYKRNSEEFRTLLFQLREMVIMSSLSSGLPGLIMTHANHQFTGHFYFNWLKSLCEKNDINLKVVNLFCTESERLRRFLSKDRETDGKPCDSQIYNKIQREWGGPIVIEGENYFSIDVERLTPDQVVDIILKQM